MSNISSEKILPLKSAFVSRCNHIFSATQDCTIAEQALTEDSLNQKPEFIAWLYLVSIHKVHMGKTLKSATL